MPQDQTAEFDSRPHAVRLDARSGRRPGDDDQVVRATLGRLLFTGDEMQKPVECSRAASGPHAVRQADAEAAQRDVMDEPTNHMDMESIESLNLALENYAGTLIFVSPRPRVRVVAGHADHRAGRRGTVHFAGNYEDYLGSAGLRART